MATPTNLPATVATGDDATATWANDIRGSFRVLQVVTNNNSTAYSNSTSTFTDVGPSVTITPQATSSKILVICNVNGAGKQTGNTSLDLRLRRQTTTIYEANNNFITGTTATNGGSVTMVYLDSPSSTAALTYKVQGASNNNNASVYAQLLAASDSTITVFEISA
jgi:hypothetical protein